MIRRREGLVTILGAPRQTTCRPAQSTPLQNIHSDIFIPLSLTLSPFLTLSLSHSCVVNRRVTLYLKNNCHFIRTRSPFAGTSGAKQSGKFGGTRLLNAYAALMVCCSGLRAVKRKYIREIHYHIFRRRVRLT